MKYAAKHGADVVKGQINWDFLGHGLAEEGVYQHYLQIAQATDFPLFAYTLDEPGMSCSLIGRLAEIPQVIGMKDDTDNFRKHRLYCLAAGPDFVAMTGGHFDCFLYGMHFGAKAYCDVPMVISPRESLAAYELAVAGRAAEAVPYIEKYELPIRDLAARFNGMRPVMKTMLWLMGHFKTNLSRLPHQGLPEKDAPVIREFLEDRGMGVVR